MYNLMYVDLFRQCPDALSFEDPQEMAVGEIVQRLNVLELFRETWVWFPGPVVRDHNHV